METKVSSATQEMTIGYGRPTVLIGERINPTGRKQLAASLEAGDLQRVQAEAQAQVQAGADILDVNVGMPGVDEVTLLPQAVQAVMEVVDVPLCLDSEIPQALEAALHVYRGKPIVNSVNGQEDRLAEILPLVKQHGAAVIGLTMDDEGIPRDVERRVAIAHKIVERAEGMGIPRKDVIIDCLALTLGANSEAGMVALESMQRVRDELGVNQTIGASNISFGMPERPVLNRAFLSLAIFAGVTCPVVNAARVRMTVLATDLILDRDRFARRYIKAYRDGVR